MMQKEQVRPLVVSMEGYSSTNFSQLSFLTTVNNKIISLKRQ